MANIQCNETDKLCPENCEEQSLPAVLFDDCAPEINKSEIEFIILAKGSAAPFADIEDLEEWETRVSLPLSDDDSLRVLRVTGDKPLPEDQTRVLSGQRNVVTDTNHTVNFDVDETNETNYEFIRKTACNSTYKLWYVTVAGNLYGGTCGLRSEVKARLVQNRGDGEIELYTGTATWKDRFDPPRSTWPLAGRTNLKPSDTNP